MNKENLILGNYSAIPNYFIDNFVSTISASECVIMLCILRKTIGFQKLEDQISLSQLVEMSGISKRTCMGCLKSLEEQQFIFIKRSIKEKTIQTNLIQINIDKILNRVAEIAIPMAKIVIPPMAEIAIPPMAKIAHTKETKQNKKEK